MRMCLKIVFLSSPRSPTGLRTGLYGRRYTHGGVPHTNAVR